MGVQSGPGEGARAIGVWGLPGRRRQVRMRGKLITIAAILAAMVGWWGLYILTGAIAPEQPGALSLFYALLFLSVTATLIPPAAFLNRRFGPEASVRDPAGFVRHSAWAGICVASWAWLQVQRSFNLGFALITVLIFVALEVLITRLRGQGGRES